MALKRTPIRRRSAKKALQDKTYLVMRKAFLEKHPYCEIWLKENGFKEEDVIFSKPTQVPGGAIVIDELQRLYTIPMATEVHHAKGRGKYYLDESTWLAVCRESHTRVHGNPSWARKQGYLF